MATSPSIQLSIAAGETSDRVLVTLYVGLGVDDVARLRGVLDDLVSDGGLVAIAVDLHQVRGDTDGISGLVAAAERAGQGGVELTLCHPTEAVREALDAAGLTGLIGMLQMDRRPPWSVRGRQGQGRRNHPSGQFPVPDPTILGTADNA
jgi:anti-anti-sigma regulatory factor